MSDGARESVDDAVDDRTGRSFSLTSSVDLMIGGVKDGIAVVSVGGAGAEADGSGVAGDDRSIKRLLFGDGRIKTRS